MTSPASPPPAAKGEVLLSVGLGSRTGKHSDCTLENALRLNPTHWDIYAAADAGNVICRRDETYHLHVAARKGHYETACHILSLGTEAVNSQVWNHNRPYLNGQIPPDPDLTRVLEDGDLHRPLSGLYGDSLGAPGGEIGRDARGRSPLFWATEYRHESLVELLLAHGADPAVQDKKGNLCLHWAASVGCAPITRMLLAAGSNPNMPNYQGDSPLHVAAQERRYECLTLLLAHGAKVCLKNKAGRMPLHCARPSSPCWSALQAFSALPPLSQVERVLSRDISRGFEQVPIPCLNGVDDEPCPSNFLYITRNVLSDSVIVPAVAAGRSQPCECPPAGCSAAACCPCVLQSKRPWYTKDGRLVLGSSDSSRETGPIFECSMFCSCSSNCPNRVVQRGIRVQLQLFRTPAKGWGVRTVQDVPRGAFLCQYFGELISSTEAARREEDAYYYVVDSQVGQERYLDGRFYGNIGRFLNHSCQPNVTGMQVAVGQEVPGIAFFSTRPICTGEELGLDYGDRFWAMKGEGRDCLCGAPTCRYRPPRKGPAAAAGDLRAQHQHRPLRGFAFKSGRANPLRIVTRSRRGPRTPLLEPPADSPQ
uniref:Uncharacterized protein n=1 Tax=Sphaerodactylus townsendi TaxID=933632 RepID=A0ACB8FK11_9SAUR